MKKEITKELLRKFPDAWVRLDRFHTVMYQALLQRAAKECNKEFSKLRNVDTILTTGFVDKEAEKFGLDRRIPEDECTYWQLVRDTNPVFMKKVVNRSSARFLRGVEKGEWDLWVPIVPLYTKFAERAQKIVEEKEAAAALKKAEKKKTIVEQSAAMETPVDLTPHFKPDMQQQIDTLTKKLDIYIDAVDYVIRQLIDREVIPNNK